MLERFIELRPYINEIVNRNSSAPAMLTAAEINIMSKVRDLLKKRKSEMSRNNDNISSESESEGKLYIYLGKLSK